MKPDLSHQEIIRTCRESDLILSSDEQLKPLSFMVMPEMSVKTRDMVVILRVGALIRK
jgi:hypothetical protein